MIAGIRLAREKQVNVKVLPTIEATQGISRLGA
jgi:hypothetical protein